MATIKSFTDIPQSKTLSKILPLESADMSYRPYREEGGIPDYESDLCPYRFASWCGFPCWSLASLLSAIPKHIKDYNVLRIDISDNDFAIWYDEIGYGVNNDLPNITKESAVDACYELIMHLNELTLL